MKFLLPFSWFPTYSDLVLLPGFPLLCLFISAHMLRTSYNQILLNPLCNSSLYIAKDPYWQCKGCNNKVDTRTVLKMHRKMLGDDAVTRQRVGSLTRAAAEFTRGGGRGRDKHCKMAPIWIELDIGASVQCLKSIIIYFIFIESAPRPFQCSSRDVRLCICLSVP